MSLRPRIARPCPARADLDAAMDGDFCRLCRQTVHDLDAMTARERCGLLADARDEVCVRYRLPATWAAAALAVAAAPLAAQTAPTPPPGTAATPGADAEMDIVVGGARRLTVAERRQLRREAYEEERRERQVRRVLFPS